MKRRKIYAIRHAEREDDVNPCWYYNSYLTKDNTPLSERGLEQASELYERFQDITKDYVFASPYCRTVETASAILQGSKTKVFIEPGFLESSHVISEAVTGFETVEDTARRFPGQIDLNYLAQHVDVTPEEGDRGNLGCKDRVFDTMNKILEKYEEGTILIIGHKSSLAAVHIYLTKGAPVYPGQATVSKYVEGNMKGRFTCEYACDSSHLSDRTELRGKAKLAY
uniref:Phosphoglycerate mutase n=1 Tax=Ditylenchus dipsaci TaxID=166011 RepID=A0A915D603_9BILA